MIIFRMFAVYPPIAASEARLLAANSRGNKKSRAAVETYDCKHCNRSFNKQYNLLIHERSHEKSENQTLFNCNICGKGFRSMNNMKNHRYCFYLSCSLHGFTKSESQISIFFLRNENQTLLSRSEIKGNGIEICSLHSIFFIILDSKLMPFGNSHFPLPMKLDSVPIFNAVLIENKQIDTTLT